MRILALNWRDIRSPLAGGAEVHLHEVLTRLVKKGHQVTLLSSRFPGARLEEQVDGIIICRTGSWWNAHVAIPKLARRLLKDGGFDLVVDDVNKIPFFAPAWSKVPVVALFHHLLGETVFMETNRAFAGYIARKERLIGKIYRFTPSIAVSESTASELLALGLRSGLVHVVKNGIRAEDFSPKFAAKFREPMLLVVSRLKAYKRIETAILAFAEVRSQIPDAGLTVIGSGDRHPKLWKLARSLALPVSFLGSVPEPLKASWLARAHLVLMPSLKEGFGLVALEAMASGTPVIATDVPGHRDALADGAGVLVPKDDPHAMAEAAVALLRNPERYATYRMRGLEISRRYDWQSTADGIESVLLDAVDRTTPAARPALQAVELEKSGWCLG